MQDTLKPIDREGDFITGVKPKRRKIRGPELTPEKKGFDPFASSKLLMETTESKS